MYVTQNALQAQMRMWQYWKKHFLTKRYPKLEKKRVRQAACPAAGRPGRSAVGVGYILFYYQLIKCRCWKVFAKALSHYETIPNSPKIMFASPSLADQPKVCVCMPGMFSLFVSNKVHFWHFDFTNKESYFNIWSRDGALSPPFIRCPPLLKVML